MTVVDVVIVASVTHRPHRGCLGLGGKIGQGRCFHHVTHLERIPGFAQT
jgi:hypothetical protein